MRIVSPSRPHSKGDSRHIRIDPRGEVRISEPAGCAKVPSIRAIMMKAALPPESVGWEASLIEGKVVEL